MPWYQLVVILAALVALGVLIGALTGRRRLRTPFLFGTRRVAAVRDEEPARRAIAESERRMRTLITATSQAFWTTDAAGMVSDSPMWRALTGQGLSEVRGSGWLEAVHPDDREAAREAWESAVASGGSYEVEYRVRLRSGTYRWFVARGTPVREDDGTIREWVGSCADIHEQRRAQEAERFLLEAARKLSSSLDLATTLRATTDLVVPRLGDYCLVYMLEGDGMARQVAAAHADPTLEPLLDELGARYRPDPRNPHSIVARTIATGVTALDAAGATQQGRLVTDDPAVHEIQARLAPESYMVVPLITRSEVLGALLIVSSISGRRHDDQDLSLARLLGARVALAIDNARLYQDAQAARDRALRTSQLESQLVQARLEVLRGQLNPHFLFNALNTIAMLVRRQADADAIRGIVSLSELLRKVLASGGMLEVPLRDELAVVEHYLSIERLRFHDRLSTRLAPAPDSLDALVPSLILQPLVENAVRHGVAGRSEGGTVSVESSRVGDRLVIEVRDDCAGLPPDWDSVRSGGVGLANTRERLHRLYDGGHSFDVRNAPGGGAVARIEIPFHT